jgi:hypothetical protein
VLSAEEIMNVRYANAELSALSQHSALSTQHFPIMEYALQQRRPADGE